MREQNNHCIAQSVTSEALPRTKTKEKLLFRATIYIKWDCCTTPVFLLCSTKTEQDRWLPCLTVCGWTQNHRRITTNELGFKYVWNEGNLSTAFKGQDHPPWVCWTLQRPSIYQHRGQLIVESLQKSHQRYAPWFRAPWSRWRWRSPPGEQWRWWRHRDHRVAEGRETPVFKLGVQHRIEWEPFFQWYYSLIKSSPQTSTAAKQLDTQEDEKRIELGVKKFKTWSLLAQKLKWFYKLRTSNWLWHQFYYWIVLSAHFYDIWLLYGSKRSRLILKKYLIQVIQASFNVLDKCLFEPIFINFLLLIINNLTSTYGKLMPITKLADQFEKPATAKAAGRGPWLKSSATMNHGMGPGPISKKATKLRMATMLT